jgi:hypothetical protein
MNIDFELLEEKIKAPESYANHNSGKHRLLTYELLESHGKIRDLQF